MSKYTTEVRYICENYSGLDESTGYGNVNDIIARSRNKVFDFNYPIYDEAYRSVLETKILKHFYTREICCETVGLWKLWLDTKLNEIMPYYNKLYESTMLEYNPLFDTDITTTRKIINDGTKNDNGNRTDNETINRSTGGNSTSDNTDNLNEWSYYSDTPQGGINGLDTLTYLTNATHNTGNNTSHNDSSFGVDEDVTRGITGTSENNTTFNNTEDYIEHITGKRGGENYSKLIEEFRKTIINIDVRIIHELDDLFMGLW